MTRLLDFLVESFVAGFGITRPRPEQQRMVRVVLGGALLAIACAAVGIVVFFWLQLR